MAKVNLDQTSYAWKQVAHSWETFFTSPSRPSDQEIKQYSVWLKKLTKGKKGLKGLVLGSTPELRDALASAKIENYAIDINLEMILAMTGLLKNPNKEEVVVRGNWLENPLRDHYFDFSYHFTIFLNQPKRAFFLTKFVFAKLMGLGKTSRDCPTLNKID